MKTNYEDAIMRAAELAEDILEEVARATQDWSRVAAWARELAELATELAALPPGGKGPATA